MFDEYRSIKWLARHHAVAVLPSIASLTSLRDRRDIEIGRQPFIGFGDPWFSVEQVTGAETNAKAQVRRRKGFDGSGMELMLKARPNTRAVDSADLALLPRLPETADEVRSIAVALNADPDWSVFVGADASEGQVKSTNLSDVRVLAFATHGLVPGDLDGLTQPALALSSPKVTHGSDDGLLTMGEILPLRLNADWVVLSACNTAAAEGIGAEAISGLGRAFFYAGARALLVSNWPVETTSTKMLVTTLFKRRAADPSLGRAEALRQAMVYLIDEGVREDGSGRPLFSYAHPLFWAPFSLVGDSAGVGRPIN